MAFAVLKSIDDPRSNLEKARRTELVKFANANGMPEISEAWPADLIRKKLRERGLTRITVNAVPLGAAPGAPGPVPDDGRAVETVDALAILEREFAQQQQAKPTNAMGINELRAECKRLGIKLSRRDNIESLRKKIKDHGE